MAGKVLYEYQAGGGGGAGVMVVWVRMGMGAWSLYICLLLAGAELWIGLCRVEGVYDS